MQLLVRRPFHPAFGFGKLFDQLRSRSFSIKAASLPSDDCNSGAASSANASGFTLMSDLIAHLRDLLVFKVKPDALADEAAPELQSSLGKEAALIETDRLLELIEQFAEAEGRMKWAPNKKLHFEVAVIKAIQTLSQVTLTEVIDNLAALRGGSVTGSQGRSR